MCTLQTRAGCGNSVLDLSDVTELHIVKYSNSVYIPLILFFFFKWKYMQTPHTASLCVGGAGGFSERLSQRSFRDLCSLKPCSYTVPFDNFSSISDFPHTWTSFTWLVQDPSQTSMHFYHSHCVVTGNTLLARWPDHNKIHREILPKILLMRLKWAN